MKVLQTGARFTPLCPSKHTLRTESKILDKIFNYIYNLILLIQHLQLRPERFFASVVHLIFSNLLFCLLLLLAQNRYQI